MQCPVDVRSAWAIDWRTQVDKNWLLSYVNAARLIILPSGMYKTGLPAERRVLSAGLLTCKSWIYIFSQMYSVVSQEIHPFY